MAAPRAAAFGSAKRTRSMVSKKDVKPFSDKLVDNLLTSSAPNSTTRRVQDLRPVRLEQHLFNDLADQVTGQDMGLLNARSFFRRNANGAIGEILDCAAGSSGQRHGANGFCPK